MLFSKEHRDTIWAELKERMGPDGRVSLGDVGKAIGEKWRGLTEEERCQYKERLAKEVQDEMTKACHEIFNNEMPYWC